MVIRRGTGTSTRIPIHRNRRAEEESETNEGRDVEVVCRKPEAGRDIY